jgi:hypothetical protein
VIPKQMCKENTPSSLTTICIFQPFGSENNFQDFLMKKIHSNGSRISFMNFRKKLNKNDRVASDLSDCE